MWADQCDCVFHKTNVYPCFHEHGGGKERAPLMKPSSGQNLAWQSLPNARFLHETEKFTFIIFLILILVRNKTGLGELRDGMMKCLTSTLPMLMDGSQGRQCTTVIVNIYLCL